MPAAEIRTPSRTWWRVLIVLCCIGLAFCIVSVLLLINRSDDAIEANRELGCQIGAYLVGTPVVKSPETSQATFERQLKKALDFLQTLRELDCQGLAKVTTEKIKAQERRFRHALEEGGGPSAGAPPGSPPGERPNGPAPPPPTPGPEPPGSPPRPPPPPPGPGPPPNPPPPDVSICIEQPLLPRCLDLDLP
jgi:hypothetical protein